MDNAKLEYFKNMLLQRRDALAEIVQRTKDYSREKDQNVQDITDMAVESYTRDFLFGKNAGDHRTLRNIEDALTRINDDIYGICENCGNEINPKRLEAIPWAALCIKCQGSLEIEKGRLG